MVRKRTSNNYTYNMGSHVMQFGALSIDEEPAADYLGELNTGWPGMTCTSSAQLQCQSMATDSVSDAPPCAEQIRPGPLIPMTGTGWVN